MNDGRVRAGSSGKYRQIDLGKMGLVERLRLLDELDVGGEGAAALRLELEAANEEIFALGRAEIAGGSDPRLLRQWLFEAREIDSAGSGVQPGLGYDLLDAVVSGFFAFLEPGEPEVPVTSEMVAYQPAPARHVLAMIDACGLSPEDVLVDLGSGLGHVPMLASILTGCRGVGVEIEPAYLRCAREAAARLGLARVGCIEGDARAADLSEGTVFFLFTPFRGAMLGEVLERLRIQGTRRQIRICSLGPCTRVLAELGWLRAVGPVDEGRITVFAAG